MMSFKKGQLITVRKIIHHKHKDYIQVGENLVEVEIQESVHPGEKLIVTSVSADKIILRPYSRVFKNIALQDIINSLKLHYDTTTFKLLQAMLTLEVPLKKENIERFYSKIQSLEIPEKLYGLLVLKDKKLDQEVIKLFREKNIKEILLFFLRLSDEKEIFLPVDSAGSFIIIKSEEKQIFFNLIFYFKHLDFVYIKGWISKDGEKGEIFIYFMPFIDTVFFTEIKKKVEQSFNGMKIYIKDFIYPKLRSVNGFF